MTFRGSTSRFFVKKSNCSMCLQDTCQESFGDQNHEFHHNKSLSCISGVNKSISVKNLTQSIDIEYTSGYFSVLGVRSYHKNRCCGLPRCQDTIMVKKKFISIENATQSVLWYPDHKFVHKNCRHGQLNKTNCSKNRHVYPRNSMTAIFWASS